MITAYTVFIFSPGCLADYWHDYETLEDAIAEAEHLMNQITDLGDENAPPEEWVETIPSANQHKRWEQRSPHHPFLICSIESYEKEITNGE